LILKKENLNLNILISEVLKEYVHKKSNKQMVKIVYDFNCKNDDIMVEGDRVRLAQVIRNLVDNAIKFTPLYNNQQTIFVIVDRKKEEGKEEQAIVSIKDTGKGISKEVLSKLFSKFTTSDSNTGTGLGLYICKNIVEAHGGKIWATNNKKNDKEVLGSTFTFSLSVKQ
jgi:signal transduction histidine kinase